MTRTYVTADAPESSSQRHPGTRNHESGRNARLPKAGGSDEDLVATMIDYQGGDGSALERLWEALALEVRKLLSLDAGAAGHGDQLLERCFLEMHQYRHTYLPPRDVRGWAFDIARYVQATDARCRNG